MYTEQDKDQNKIPFLQGNIANKNNAANESGSVSSLIKEPALLFANVDGNFSQKFPQESDRIQEIKSIVTDQLNSYSASLFSCNKSCSKNLNTYIKEIFSGDGSTVVLINMISMLENEVKNNPLGIDELANFTINQYSGENDPEFHLELSDIEKLKILNSQALLRYTNSKFDENLGIGKRWYGLLFNCCYKSFIQKILNDLIVEVKNEVKLRKSSAALMIGWSDSYTPTLNGRTIHNSPSLNSFDYITSLFNEIEKSPLLTPYNKDISKSLTLEKAQMGGGLYDSSKGITPKKTTIFDKIGDIDENEEKKGSDRSGSFTFFKGNGGGDHIGPKSIEKTNKQFDIINEDLLGGAELTEERMISYKPSFISKSNDYAKKDCILETEEEMKHREDMKTLRFSFEVLEKNWSEWEKFSREDMINRTYLSDEDFKELLNFRSFLFKIQNMISETINRFEQETKDLTSQTVNSRLADLDTNKLETIETNFNVNYLEKLTPIIKNLRDHNIMFKLYGKNAEILYNNTKKIKLKK